MPLWIDAQLSPHLAPWLEQTFHIQAFSVRHLGLRDAHDRELFAAARAADAVVVTKDRDFVQLLELLGPPPQILWITCGNASNDHLRGILLRALPQALELLDRGEPLVEIGYP